MIQYFAAHKLAVMIGLAAVALVLVLRAKNANAAPAGGPPVAVDPYSSTPPSVGDGGLTLPAPPYGEPAPTTPGPGVSNSSTSTGPGAGPTVALGTTSSTIDYGGTQNATGLLGDVSVFSPQVAGYNPIYGPGDPIMATPTAIVGTSGTVSDPSTAPVADRSPQAIQGAVALVDPSGHVVNAKGARVGGFAGD